MPDLSPGPSINSIQEDYTGPSINSIQEDHTGLGINSVQEDQTVAPSNFGVRGLETPQVSPGNLSSLLGDTLVIYSIIYLFQFPLYILF